MTIPTILTTSQKLSTGVDARAPGMELEILGVDESELYGLFKTFVKQLQYQSLART